jgi:hypothetical protein
MARLLDEFRSVEIRALVHAGLPVIPCRLKGVGFTNPLSGTLSCPNSSTTRAIIPLPAYHREVGVQDVSCRGEERARPEDVGEQALVRGLDTAFPFVRLGLSRSKSGRRSRIGHVESSEVPLPWSRPHCCTIDLMSSVGCPYLIWTATRSMTRPRRRPLKKKIADTHKGARIRLLFLDKALIGQKGRVCHVWWKRGRHPSGLARQALHLCLHRISTTPS